jgi:hypothetical protein
MPDEPKIANTQDLANMEYDAERLARVGSEQKTDPKKAAPTTEEAAEVGLLQSGTDKDAIGKPGTDFRRR